MRLVHIYVWFYWCTFMHTYIRAPASLSLSQSGRLLWLWDRTVYNFICPGCHSWHFNTIVTLYVYSLSLSLNIRPSSPFHPSPGFLSFFGLSWCQGVVLVGTISLLSRRQMRLTITRRIPPPPFWVVSVLQRREQEQQHQQLIVQPRYCPEWDGQIQTNHHSIT